MDKIRKKMDKLDVTRMDLIIPKECRFMEGIACTIKLSKVRSTSGKTRGARIWLNFSKLRKRRKLKTMANDFVRFQDENQTVSLCREKVTLLYEAGGKCVIHMDNGDKISIKASFREIASRLENGCANCEYRILHERRNRISNPKPSGLVTIDGKKV